MTAMTDALLRAGLWFADPATPPDDLVTPGIVGFVATFLIAIVTVFLLIDMNRRVRRTRYREEVRDQLESERRDDGTTQVTKPED
jgi:hypothetical protein